MADELEPTSPAPALSATSDMPVIDPANALPVDETPKPAETSETEGPKPPGEADDQPQAPEEQEVGEEKDKTSPQQRAVISRERNRRQAAEREASELKEQLKQALAGIEKLTAPPKEDLRPAREHYSDPETYEAALVAWSERRTAERVQAEAKQQAERQRVETQVKEIETTYQEKVAEFSEGHPDYEEIVYAEGKFKNPVISTAIKQAENGPAVAYYVAQNPDVEERLNGLTPMQAVYEIGRISQRLAQQTTARPRPNPINPLRGGNAASAANPDPASMPMDQYARYYRDREKARTN